MSEVARRLIRRAVADLQRSVSGNPTHRAINHAYAIASIEMAYAESCITDAEHDEFSRQVQQVELDSREVASA